MHLIYLDTNIFFYATESKSVFNRDCLKLFDYCQTLKSANKDFEIIDGNLWHVNNYPEWQIKPKKNSKFCNYEFKPKEKTKWMIEAEKSIEYEQLPNPFSTQCEEIEEIKDVQ